MGFGVTGETVSAAFGEHGAARLERHDASASTAFRNGSAPDAARAHRASVVEFFDPRGEYGWWGDL
jgi:hypothetical protein